MCKRRLFVYFLLIQALWSCKHRFFRASSASMENTLMAGQKFYVEPTGKFERNDIVVFNYFGNDYSSPEEEPRKFKQHWEKRVYRLIAHSGDVLEIKEGEVFVNNRRIQPPPSALFRYEIKSGVSLTDLVEKNPDLVTVEQRGDTMVYELPLTVTEAQDYGSRKPAIISIRRKAPYYSIDDSSFAKGGDTGNWSVDNYGPLTIPSPGETIPVNPSNYKIYKNIPGVTQGNYLLKENLFFLLGDNRYNSEDSRFIGLIPQSNMYGIVK